MAILVAGLLAGASCAAADSGANVSPNPGFELLNPAGDNFPLNWSAEKDPTGKAGVTVDKDAHGGAIAIRQYASADGIARVNSDPMNVRRGTVRFHYKALKSGAAGTNLCAYAIAISSGGVEVGRVGASALAEHVGDGQWHQASFDFDFVGKADVSGVLLAARINEGSPNAEVGEWLIDDFEVVEARLGPRATVEAFYMARPVMVTGRPAEVAAIVASTGDDPLPASKLRLVLPGSVRLASGSVETEIDALQPGDSRRVVWSIVGSKREELSIRLDWRGEGFEAEKTRRGVCVGKLNMREVCSDSEGFWRFMPAPAAVQDGAGAMAPLKILRSSQLPDSMIGVTAHIPRSKDLEVIFEAEHLIDGDYATSWSGRAHATEAYGGVDWAQVDFSGPSEIREIRLTPYHNAEGFPVDFAIKLRSGGKWKQVYEGRRIRVPAEDGGKRKRPFGIPLSKPVRADALRIEATRFGSPSSFYTDCAASYHFMLSEIEAIDASGRNVALASRAAKASVCSTHCSYFNSTRIVRDTYAELYNLGVKWNRIGQWGDWTCWAAVERRKGEYYIDPTTDAAITESVKNGVNILYTLAYGNPLYEETTWLSDPGPVWRHGHPFTGDGGPTKPESIQGFVNYATFVAKHFKGRVRYYEIWNEENSWAWYGSPPDPKAFGTLLRETAKALKEIDPEIKVMVGGTAALAPTFISQALEEGGGKCLDAIAFHPYTMPYPEMGLGALDIVDGKQAWKDKKELGYDTCVEMIKFYRETFAKYNPDFEFWANEWNAVPTREDSPYRGLSEIQEAKQIARFFLMATLTQVRAVWWSLANQNFLYDWGLLRSDDLSPKPAYYTLQAMCTLLSGAKSDTSVNAHVRGEVPDLRCEVLRGRDGETLIALWCASNPVDEFKPARVTLTVDRPAHSADAVDTFHCLVQKLNTRHEAGSTVIDDLLVTDYPVIVRVK